MTQRHRGSPHDELSDLRRIVDRLDLLTGSAGAPPDGAPARTRTTEALGALVARVDALEREVDELRTLVDHLMTIATWQARVTATLVDERAQEETTHGVDDDRPVNDGDGPARSDASARTTTAAPPAVSHRRYEGDGRPGWPPPATRAGTAAADDVDDVLGASRTNARQGPPRDFGI